jgi:hypothetical protein
MLMTAPPQAVAPALENLAGHYSLEDAGDAAGSLIPLERRRD